MSPHVGSSGHAHDKCRELLEQLSTYVDGDLTGPERKALVAHLRRCPCCQSMADGLQQTVAACRKAKTARLPADVRARAKARIATLLASGAGAVTGARPKARSPKPDAKH